MKFTFKKFGYIEEGSVELADLTLICGSNCLDPSDHKLYKFGKLYRARQVLRSLMTDRNTIDEHS